MRSPPAQSRANCSVEQTLKREVNSYERPQTISGPNGRGGFSEPDLQMDQANRQERGRTLFRPRVRHAGHRQVM